MSSSSQSRSIPYCESITAGKEFNIAVKSKTVTEPISMHGFSFHHADSAPTVLMLHGAPQNLNIWHRVVPYFLSAQYNVVLADLRGYGL